jgi:hypothetical protein
MLTKGRTYLLGEDGDCSAFRYDGDMTGGYIWGHFADEFANDNMHVLHSHIERYINPKDVINEDITDEVKWP